MNPIDHEHILMGSPRVLGFACPLCLVVYVKVFECRWQARTDRRLRMEHICKYCYHDLKALWVKGVAFDHEDPDCTPYLTGNIKELPKKF